MPIQDPAQDPALNPSHYQHPCSSLTAPIIRRFTGIEPDRFDECKYLIKELNLNYFAGAAIKYLWRCQKKGSLKADYVRDLGKAIEHLKELPKSIDRSTTIHEIQCLITQAEWDGSLE